ncbi:hypothetical protein COU15_02375 [Candidatus Kaiserbacteria bacterium CG10_big_fil_rev_8_21_14_0_10_45_20]|uniref:ParB/Sulfiredoxin domain-containing protein n=1 Tax=Candidatus Kaiserbacteria bacterium CG10_big_fil_rev_8_21_14_0_10_45_20 TaxID=1974607 RepID=A0A2H0UFN9_9BACT|nr:MAG: hypothetical protein COU15_02375 [Candidatus Kaiserbacteria bacterium CG10_big_fil_rev_8_21_14_0_10_45_20]
MSDQELRQQIQHVLPNFPEEPIDLWLLPYAKKLGWPPGNNERWANILAGRPITFWESTIWSKRQTDLATINHSETYYEKARGMFNAFVLGQENEYSHGLGEEGKNKFLNLLKQMLETGVFPEPPILFEDEPDHYDILDGNHRWLAYVMCWRIWEEVENMTPEERRDRAAGLHASNIIEPVQNQEVWFCELPH